MSQSKDSAGTKLSMTDHTFEAILWKINGPILELTLNRPHKKNAINFAMANELIYAFQFAKQESSIRVVVLGAEGDIFCAGGDLSAMSGKAQETKSTVPPSGQLNDLSPAIRDLCKPVIVKAQGSVLAGALLLVTPATHVIAADHTKFSAPEIKRGLWPYMVMAGLFRVIPKRVGLDWIMRGFEIDTATAIKWGLINEAVSKDNLDAAVDKIATELSQLPPNTMQLGLEAYNVQESQSFSEAMPYLSGMLARTLAEGDAKEGISAFFEKRKPNWLD